MIEDFKQRGVLADITGDGELERLLASNEKITLYCGFDPTADSLHIGNMLPLVNMKRFMDAGHNVIALVGGSTGLIGDPSGKSSERNLNSEETVEVFKGAISKQIRSFLGDSVTIVDNLDWTSGVSMIEFLRDIGKNFSVNQMMAKESVRQRFDRDAEGISFTEFSYQILQGYDFYVLNKKYNCVLQIGGSDQMGNITAGTGLIHKKMGHDAHAYGLTTKLLTTASGEKFGKSEGNAVWLDSNKTSPFDFFQFWLKSTDEEVYKLLRFFSSKSVKDIESIEAVDSDKSEKPLAQILLAEEMTFLVHGQEGLDEARNITQAMNSGNFSEIKDKQVLESVCKGIDVSLIEQNPSLINALVGAKLATSNSQARTFIKSNAISLNGKKVTDIHYQLEDSDFITGEFAFLKRGKRNMAAVRKSVK